MHLRLNINKEKVIHMTLTRVLALMPKINNVSLRWPYYTYTPVHYSSNQSRLDTGDEQDSFPQHSAHIDMVLFCALRFLMRDWLSSAIKSTHPLVLFRWREQKIRALLFCFAKINQLNVSLTRPKWHTLGSPSSLENLHLVLAKSDDERLEILKQPQPWRACKK